jgi:hypothetical protein
MRPKDERWVDGGARTWATLLGLAPLLAVSLITTALLWGTGQDLRGGEPLSDARDAVAWLGLVALLLLVAHPLLGYVARVLRGDWSILPFRWLERQVVRRQRERRLKGAWPQLYPSEFLRPTLLGNVELAVAERVGRRYRLDLAVAWPRLAVLLPGAERLLVDRATRRLDAAVFRAAGWALAAVPLLAAAAASRSLYVWLPMEAGAVVAVLFSRSAYREAVGRSIALGQLMESATDIHRLALLDALGLRRPATADEEYYLFALVSRWLGGSSAGNDLDEHRVPDDGVAGEAAVARHLDRFSSTLDQTVSEAVDRGVGSSIDAVLPSAVERTLLRSLAGPTLDNFDGHLSALLLDGEERPLPIDEDGRVRVVPGSVYRLRVFIGPRAPAGATSTPLRIRGGNRRPEVTFGVSVDSNVAAARVSEVPVTIPSGRTAGHSYPVDLTGAETGEPWLWVRVTQHGRTVQNLHLTLVTAESPA